MASDLEGGEDAGAPVMFRDVLEEMGLVEFDFQRSLGIDLRAERHRLSWRRFKVLLSGLLATETLVNARFHPRRDAPPSAPAVPPGGFD